MFAIYSTPPTFGTAGASAPGAPKFWLTVASSLTASFIRFVANQDGSPFFGSIFPPAVVFCDLASAREDCIPPSYPVSSDANGTDGNVRILLS